VSEVDETTPAGPVRPDKQVTVAVPEDRVPEFYAWFAQFLAADPERDGRRGRGPGGRRGGPRGHRGGPHGRPDGFPFGGHRSDDEVTGWTADDAEEARWLYGKLAPPARQLFDVLARTPGARISGNDLAAELGLDKGAHGVAGILAWPGRYSRRLGRVMPIATEGREDGGTDYYIEPDVAALFTPPATG
jgi:hypothetical protein